MANQVAMIAIYDLLGFSPRTSEILYTDQGMDELAELSIMFDAEVESLYKLVCRTGGLISNLHAVGASQPAMINAPGHTISMKAVTNLKLAY